MFWGARQADMESDIALARHVTFVHQFKKNPELDFEPFDPTFLKLYISQVMFTCECTCTGRWRATSSSPTCVGCLVAYVGVAARDGLSR